MSESKGYQGYANYETWACALWIDNDHGLYDTRREMVRMTWTDSEYGENERENQSTEARSDLSEILKNWIEEMAPTLGATMFSDLLTAAISEIDFYELADAWLNEEINENGEGGYIELKAVA